MDGKLTIPPSHLLPHPVDWIRRKVMLYRLAPVDRIAWLGLSGSASGARVVEAEDLAGNILPPVSANTRLSAKQAINHARLPTRMTHQQQEEVRPPPL